MLKLLLGDPNARKLKRYQPIVSDISLLEEEVAPLSDEQLRGLTAEFREKLSNLQEECQSRRLSLETTLERERKLLDELLPRPSPGCVRRASACWACATSMCS